MVLDGKVVDTDRLRVKTLSKKGKVIDAWYSGKTHDFGGNVQAPTRPDGFPVWISPVEPGSVHDLTAHLRARARGAGRRRLPRTAHPRRPGLRRRRERGTHPGQTARRRL